MQNKYALVTGGSRGIGRAICLKLASMGYGVLVNYKGNKEAAEETGLTVKPISDSIFDVDIHHIPQRKDVPAHLHYDIRFLFAANLDEPLIMNQQETRDIKWVPIRDVELLNGSEEMMRMVRKTLEVGQR